MTEPTNPFDPYARAVLAVNRLTPSPADQARLEATISQFRAMADLLHNCLPARYASPSMTMHPLCSQDHASALRSRR